MTKNAIPKKPVPRVPAKGTSRAVTNPDLKLAANSGSKKDLAHKDRKAVKPQKEKVIRDSFTMPEAEHRLIAAIKKRCIAKGLAVKKSEILRAAVSSLATQSDSYIKTAVEALEVIKTGRPPKGK